MMLAIFCLVVVLSSTAPPQAQPPGIAEALRVQQKDPAAAAAILDSVTAREPKNARAWRLVGSVRQALKQWDAAIVAYQKAIALGPDPS
jgi:Tfp pilus assembly protein PilF